MNKIRILAAAAGMMALVGCNKENGIVQTDAGSITIQATIGQMTKVAYNGNGSSFTAGDTILLYGWTGSNTAVPERRVVDARKNGFDGHSWIPSNPMFWKNSTEAHYFIGIYPVPDSVTSFTEAAYTVDSNNYESNDLLIATNLAGVKATDGPVNLNFDHVMARLDVNLKLRSEFEGTPAATGVKITAKSTAKVNYLTKKVTATGSASAIAVSKAAIPAAGYDITYSSPQVPQSGVRKITVTVGDKEYVYTSATDIPLESGKRTTVNLTIGRDKVVIDNVTVTDWTEGAHIVVPQLYQTEDVCKFMKDEKFKAFCLAHYDTDKNGKIDEYEAAAVTSMDVSAKGIKFLAGIEYFTNLTTLDCARNDLEYLDVSKNTKLKNLDCSYNYFESFYIKKGQTFENLQTARKFHESPITLKVNGNYSGIVGDGGKLTFTATLADTIDAKSLTWRWTLDASADPFVDTHQIKDHADIYELNYSDIKDYSCADKRYYMYAETPDGIKNYVSFFLCGDNPQIHFAEPAHHCYANIDEIITTKVFHVQGKSQTEIDEWSYQFEGDGCSLSNGQKDRTEMNVSWSKPGNKRVVVRIQDEDGLLGYDTLHVHVVEVKRIEL